MDHLQSVLAVKIAQLSDKGAKTENQDTVGAFIPEGGQLTLKGIAVAIADGVSSSQAAKQASQAAVTGFLNDYYATPDTWRTQQSASRVIQALNRYLWGLSRNSVLEQGFLTTFSCIILKGDKVFGFHVGDSRIYRLRGNALELLTRDHNQKIDSKTTYLSRALGADSIIEIDSFSEEVAVGDRFVLTTDGIHESLSHQTLQTLVKSSIGLEELCKKTKDEAVTAGSSDNLSIQIVDVVSLGTPNQNDAVTVLSKLPFPPPLNVGENIDGLRVEKILHESERSQVYVVSDTRNNRYVMKTPSQHYIEDPAYIERFVLESWIGQRIQNSHIVKVVTPPRERTFLYYLTEYVAGPTLTELIDQRAPIAIVDTVELVEQIVKGVRGFHRRDTLHQDIKPDNIIVGRNGICIIDFGSCYVAGIQEVGSVLVRDKILGTLTYSAPEYRYGGDVGMHSEQFSIAVICYKMLTGHHPYGKKYEQAMSLKAFQRLKYIPARSLNPLVPAWLDSALEKSLSIYPSQRYTSMSEWLQDLKHPNPRWIQPKERPLSQRNPLLLWQMIAACGWACAIAMLIYIS